MELPLLCSVIPTCRAFPGPHVKGEYSSVGFPSHPRQKQLARAGQLFLSPKHQWRDYPKFRGSTHSIFTCLLLLRGSEKPSLNCKSGLIISHTNNSQHYAALPEGEGLVWFTPTSWKKGRGRFREDTVVDNIELQSTNGAGLHAIFLVSHYFLQLRWCWICSCGSIIPWLFHAVNYNRTPCHYLQSDRSSVSVCVWQVQRGEGGENIQCCNSSRITAWVTGKKTKTWSLI